MVSVSNVGNERLVYTVEEAGRLLGLSRSSSYEGVRTGSIPSIRVGGRVLVPKKALEKLLDSAGQLRAPRADPDISDYR